METKNRLVPENGSLERQRPQISLDGTWDYHVPPCWGYTRGPENILSINKFDGQIKVPGCWQNQTGAGAELAFKTNYRGSLYWRRRFLIPEEWRGKKVWLSFGGVLPSAHIWFNQNRLGYSRTSRSAFCADVSDLARIGQENFVMALTTRWPSLRLDGAWDSISQWEGIYRSVTLSSTGPVWLEDVFPQADAEGKKVNIEVRFGSASPARLARGRLKFRVFSPSGKCLFTHESRLNGKPLARFSIPAAKVGLEEWSCNHPVLYRLEASLGDTRGREEFDRCSTSFGLRTAEVKGNKIHLNGRPVFLSGFGDDQMNVHTVCPNPSKEYYVKLLSTAKSFGFNWAKSCCEVFTPEYLSAADEVGMLVTQEMPFGVDNIQRSDRYQPSPQQSMLYRKELANIVWQSRNHPSVIHYSMASELLLESQSKESFALFNQELPAITHKFHPNALVTDATQGAGLFVDTPLGKRNTDTCEINFWRDAGMCRSISSGDRPLTLHEFGSWVSYPDPADEKKFKGTPFHPAWYRQMKEEAGKAGLLGILSKTVKASRKLQAICRKDGIEHARKEGNVAGFVLWLIQDILQYTEGLLDHFGKPKEIVPADLIGGNADTAILLADHLDYRRCWWCGEKMKLGFVISHYGEHPLKKAAIEWRFSLAGKTLAKGRGNIEDLACGRTKSFDLADISIPTLPHSDKVRLEVKLTAQGRVINANRWDFWFFVNTPLQISTGTVLKHKIHPRLAAPYPFLKEKGDEKISRQTRLIISGELDRDIWSYLTNGGKVLLLSSGSLPRAFFSAHCLANAFRTPFCDSSHSSNGVLLDNKHPVFKYLPNEGYADLQFAQLLEEVFPVDLESLGLEHTTPLMRGLEGWAKPRHKAYAFEARVGKGRLMVVALQIWKNAGRPETQALFDALLRYCASSAFNPKSAVHPGLLEEKISWKSESRRICWRTIGPFDNLKMTGFAKVYAPEQGIDFFRSVQGAGEEMTWKKIDYLLDDDVLDFLHIYPKSQWVLAYACTALLSDRSRKVNFHIGHERGIKLWLNGKPVFETDKVQGARPNNHIVPVTLAKGPNVILIKSPCYGEGLWPIFFAVRDEANCLPAGVIYDDPAKYDFSRVVAEKFPERKKWRPDKSAGMIHCQSRGLARDEDTDREIPDASLVGAPFPYNALVEAEMVRKTLGKKQNY